MKHRELTSEEQAELNHLNAAVFDAMKERSEWLNRKMVETAHLKVGDEIFSVHEGRRLGVVSRIFRLEPDEPFYRSLSVEYEFQTGPYTFSNTVAEGPKFYGSRAQAVLALQRQAAHLENPSRPIFGNTMETGPKGEGEQS